MKFSEVFQVVKPQYVFLKLKPNNSIRNNSTHLVARTISSMYKNVFQSIVVEEKKLVRLLGKEFFLGTKYQFHVQGKVAYFVYIEKKKIEFYFIVPKQYESILTEKVGDVWNNVTIEEVGELPSFHEKATKYQLVYEKEDAMSLKVDRRDNDLLRSNLNIVDVLEEGDKVGIMYNFIPSSQESFKFSYKATVEKVKKGIPVERNKMGANYLFKMAIGIVDGLVKDVSEVLAGKKEQLAESSWLETLVDRLQGGRKLSEGTESKIRNQILPSQIIILSESQDKLREMNNGRSLANSFEIISEDNRLVAKKLGGKVNLLKNNLGTEINKLSDQECQNFISLAGRELLEMHDCIEKVETHETLVPEDLQKGKVSIGESTYRGHKQTAYLTTDREYENLSLIIIGPNRAGKSTLIGNLTNDALNVDECVVLFDFIENCELSSEVAALFDPEKVLVIDCSDDKKAEGLGYNEIKKSADTFEQYKNAKLQTSQLETLVNSINADESRLSPKMERYLQSAANVVFLVGGSIKDVFTVLQNHKARGQYLSKVPEKQYENLEEYMESLRELDERDKDGLIIGTKLHLVVGIIDRLNKLKANAFMELMLKKSTDQNIDLVEETQKAQLIIVKMPETMFPTDNEKDICSTYWMTKLWLAMQVRADKVRDKSKRRKVNFIIDELYQVKNTERFLTEKLSRLPKFRIKPIISCHYLNQIKTIREELRSANASYMLIAGCDKKNFDELKSELYPFTEEDLLRLPRYHSMNLIKSREGYGRFITKLPKPVGKKESANA
ncbi:hypothetical protein M3175_07695 [Robertmurraya korlensis]|uniref:hypothetical protein n=1 Tax=Robertmurraya korlensis TaxID=519977 RepID=UPI00203AC6CA|nr:hypothetical protein [Robertmurraya korlensis]MCM3600610.1 hypothetical protein [Robertmurraya korlensis]